MRGITPVVAVIILLLVTVSLVGGTFIFFQRFSSSAAEKTQNTTEGRLQQLGGIPKIEGVSQNTVYVRNAGTKDIVNPVFYVDSKRVDAAGPSSLEPDAIGTYALDEAQLSGIKAAVIRVTSGGFSDTVTAILSAASAVSNNIIAMGSVLNAGMTIASAQAQGILFQNSGGTTIAIVTDAGNVGIGTAAPTSILTLGGFPSITVDTSSGSDTKRLTLSASGAYDATRGAAIGLYGANYLGSGAGDIDFYTGVSGASFNFITGNVGIGTTSPTSKLHVSGDVLISGTVLNLGNGGNFFLGAAASNTDVFLSGTNLIFRSGGGPTEGMRLTSTGNLGIGTTNPQAPLEVYKGANDYIRLGAGGVRMQINVLGAGQNALRLQTTTGTTAFDVHGSDGATGRTFSVSAGGSGIFSAADATSITTTQDSPAFLFTSKRWNGASSVTAGQGAIKQLTLGVSGSNDDTGLVLAGAGSGGPGANQLFLRGSGNVGIGTTSPQSALQVAGNYIQFPVVSGSAPPGADCDSASEYGRVKVRTDGATNLYVCTAAGWAGK